MSSKYKKAKEYNSTKHNKFILVTRSTDAKGLLGLLRVTDKTRIYSHSQFSFSANLITLFILT